MLISAIRPNILMFGDCEWVEEREFNQKRRYQAWLAQNCDKKIVIIEIGAGVAIPTVRIQSEKIVKNYDAKLIRINPRDFEIDSDIGVGIALGGLEGLQSIL